MKKKQLIISFAKKIVAFILDIIIAFPLIIILEFILAIMISLFIEKKYITVIERLLDILLLIIYFYFIPKFFGNTFGRKILRVKDRFNLFWSPLHKLDKLPSEHLRKNEILKVIVQEGKWICPSCNNPSLEIYDTCDICGQEIDKIRE